jgi:hypothetical protein
LPHDRSKTKLTEDLLWVRRNQLVKEVSSVYPIVRVCVKGGCMDVVYF